VDPIAYLALACIVFLLLHVVPSTPLRPALVGAVGERAYLGLFSLASLAGIVWMVIAIGSPLKCLAGKGVQRRRQFTATSKRQACWATVMARVNR